MPPQVAIVCGAAGRFAARAQMKILDAGIFELEPDDQPVGLLLFAPPKRAFETFDGELAAHYALEVGAADVMIQLSHLDVPVKNLANSRQNARKCRILVRN